MSAKLQAEERPEETEDGGMRKGSTRWLVLAVQQVGMQLKGLCEILSLLYFLLL